MGEEGIRQEKAWGVMNGIYRQTLTLHCRCLCPWEGATGGAELFSAALGPGGGSSQKGQDLASLSSVPWGIDKTL